MNDFMTNPERGCAPQRGIDPEIFFATPRAPEVIEAGLAPQAKRDKAQARRVCGGCPVAQACFTWADQQGERSGIWGGVDMASDRERRKAGAKYGLAGVNTEPVVVETDEVLVKRVLSAGPGAFKALSEAQRILVVRAALEQGMSWSAIERKYRVNTPRLKALVGEDAESFDTRVRRLYHEGRSDQAIALTLECNPKRIYNTRARLGLPALFGPGGRLRRRIADAQRSRVGAPA